MEVTSTLLVTIMLIHKGLAECKVDKNTGTLCVNWRYGGCQRYEEQILPPVTCQCFSTTLDEINSKLGGVDVDTHLFITNTTFQVLNPGYSWKHVTKLIMKSTNITQIVPGFFSGLNNLLSLRVVNCNLTDSFLLHLSPLALLEDINLSNNNILNMNEYSIWAMHDLKIINFSKNRISFLPDGIFKYQEKLRRIDFSENKLKHIEQIRNIETLELANFSYNVLEIIGENFTSSSLTNLDLSFNNIWNISANSFVKSTSLKALDISYNSLKNVSPTTFTSLEELEYINISHNSLHVIEENFSSLSLVHLYVGFNNISNISVNSFIKSTSLVILDLSHNLLKLLAAGVFRTLGKLLQLNLSNNKIASIPFGLFTGLKSLKYLDLSDNTIFFNIHTLTPLVNLETLQIAGNMNKNLDVTFLVNHFKQIKNLSIDDVNWTCSKLAIILHQLQIENISISSKQHENSSNINGIKCNEDLENEEKSIVFNYNNTNTKESRGLPDDFQKTVFFKFFNKDFENTGFFRLINKTINQNITIVSEVSEILTNISTDLKQIVATIGNSTPNLDGITRNNLTIVSDDKVFRNISTNLKRIVETIKNSTSNLNDITRNNTPNVNKIVLEDLYKTEFFKFFNKDFQNTNFFKFINRTLDKNFSSVNEVEQFNQREQIFNILRNISTDMRQMIENGNKNFIRVNSTPNSIHFDRSISTNDTEAPSLYNQQPNISELLSTKLKENSDLLKSILKDTDDSKADIVSVKTITIIALLLGILGICFMIYKNYVFIKTSRNRNEDVSLT